MQNSHFKKGLISGTIVLIILSNITPIVFGNKDTFSQGDKHFGDLEFTFYKDYGSSKYEILKKDILYDISDSDKIKSEDIITPVETESIILSSGPLDSPWPMFGHDLSHTGRSDLSTAKNPGAELWRIQTRYNSGMFQTTPVIDNNGTIYIGLKSFDHISYLIAYDTNGTEKWRFLSENWIWSTPALGDDGTIYFTTCGDYFYAVNPNGSLKWRYDHDSYCIYSSPAIATDGTIYFGTGLCRVYALRLDGTKKWHHMLGGSVDSTPVIGPDGTIYRVWRCLFLCSQPR